MVKQIRDDNSGQSALFDAVIYLIIMIVASGLIAVYAGQYVRNVELSENQDMMEYCRYTSEVVFGATLNSTWYEDINGHIVRKPPGDTTVMNLLLEELYLRDCGVPKENFVLGFNGDITILARNLVTPNFHFAITAIFNNQNTGMSHHIFISDIIPTYQTKKEAQEDDYDYSKSVPKNNLASVQKTLPMMGKEGDVTLTSSIWR